MSEIFIGHVEEDARAGLQLAIALEAAGYATWTNEVDSTAGTSILQQTGNAIERAAALLVVLSRRALESRRLNEDILRGAKADKPFVPVLLDFSEAEFKEAHPTWHEAMGDCAYIEAAKDDLAPAATNVVQRLDALGAPKYPKGNERRVERLEGVLEQAVARDKKNTPG